MSDRYEYEIDEKTTEIAINELGENPSQVNAHIESLRRWVKSMPHLQCPTDAEFLLRFLRVSKFDHIKAQKRIDNFCTVRTSERGFPDYFKSYPIDHSVVEDFLKMKFMTPLGKTDSGETIMLIRYDDWDPDNFSVEDIVRMSFMTIDALISDEDCQILGLKILLDMSGVNKKILETVCDPKMLKASYTSFQDSYPVRFKGQLFCGDSALLDLFFQIILFFLNDKMKKRTSRLSHDISKVVDKIPGLDKILPTEYNGHGGTLNECSERWNERFKRFYRNGHPLQSIHVDEAKRPKDTLIFLATHKDFNSDDGLQKEGTFTKFENIF